MGEAMRKRGGLVTTLLTVAIFVVSQAHLVLPSDTAPDTIAIELGQEEDGLPNGTFGLQNFPDGHISFLRDGDGVNMWIAAGPCAYLLQGSTFDDLAPFRSTRPGAQEGCGSGIAASPVLMPSGTGFDSTYAAFGTVLPGPDPPELLGIYHGEQCSDSGRYTATIGLAVSGDFGKTWQRRGAIVTGRDQAPVCARTSGAGQPSAIIVGDFIYLYYTDWGPDRADQIYLARAPLASGGMPGAWQKFSDGNFGSPGIGGNSSPIIRPTNPGDTFAAVAGVSYNVYLGRYLMSFATAAGFSFTTSQDGIHWQPGQLLMAVPPDQAAQRPGSVWYAYPTLLSPSEQSHLQTAQSGYLYYAKGVYDAVPHHLMRRRFTLQRAEVPPAPVSSPHSTGIPHRSVPAETTPGTSSYTTASPALP
jgi:hypothetical protein